MVDDGPEDYDSKNITEMLFNSKPAAIGTNMFSPDDVFYADSKPVWDIVNHFEVDYEEEEETLSVQAVLNEDYDMRGQHLKSPQHVFGDLAYTFFEMFRSSKDFAETRITDFEDIDYQLEALSDYGKLKHNINGKESSDIIEEANEDIPPEARQFEFDDGFEDDDNRKYAEADSSFKESMAESYFRRYGRDAEFEEI